MARDVQAGWPLPDNVNELILCGDGLAEAHMLLLLLDSFNDRSFLLLEFESHQAGLTFRGTIKKDRARMQKSDVDLRLLLIILIE